MHFTHSVTSSLSFSGPYLRRIEPPHQAPPQALSPPPCRGGPYFPNKSPVFPLFVTVWGTGVRIFTSGAANHWITGKFSLLIIGLLSLETPLAC